MFTYTTNPSVSESVALNKTCTGTKLAKVSEPAQRRTFPGSPELLSKLPLIVSVVFLAVSFYAFLALLQVADLSFAVPATALSLVAETILARLLLKEKVTAARWAGTALVTCGVYLLAL